uniref:Uncharacterized protein n=1 Tax=Oryza brachyantha TaxID=4533 RepID=J3MSA5_ORYBR
MKIKKVNFENRDSEKWSQQSRGAEEREEQRKKQSRGDEKKYLIILEKDSLFAIAVGSSLSQDRCFAVARGWGRRGRYFPSGAKKKRQIAFLPAQSLFHEKRYGSDGIVDEKIVENHLKGTIQEQMHYNRTLQEITQITHHPKNQMIGTILDVASAIKSGEDRQLVPLSQMWKRT